MDVRLSPEQQALRESLARGATKALHVKGDAGDADSLGIAKVLAAAIKSVPHDVVLFGVLDGGVGGDLGRRLRGVTRDLDDVGA